jgi:hypothetical protein
MIIANSLRESISSHGQRKGSVKERMNSLRKQRMMLTLTLTRELEALLGPRKAIMMITIMRNVKRRK